MLNQMCNHKLTPVISPTCRNAKYLLLILIHNKYFLKNVYLYQIYETLQNGIKCNVVLSLLFKKWWIYPLTFRNFTPFSFNKSCFFRFFISAPLLSTYTDINSSLFAFYICLGYFVYTYADFDYCPVSPECHSRSLTVKTIADSVWNLLKY